MNLDPDAEFYNSAKRSEWFKSWEAKAKSGGTHAKAMVNRFAKRPAYELYDVTADTYEMDNLAGDPKHKAVLEDLKTKLQAWMQSQGDKGMETELKAFERMLSGNGEWKEWANENRPDLYKSKKKKAKK